MLIAGCPVIEVTEFQIEIMSEIFGLENHFGHFGKAETCSFLAV